jgi:hypothetical protein
MVYVPIQMPLFKCLYFKCLFECLFKCLYSNASIQMPLNALFKCLDSNASIQMPLYSMPLFKCLYSNALESLHSPLSPCTSPLVPQSGIRYQPCSFLPLPNWGSNPDALRLALYCHHLRPSVYYCSGHPRYMGTPCPPYWISQIHQPNPSVKLVSQIHQSFAGTRLVPRPV